jgi:hypothetical protein
MEQNQWASVGTHTPETLDNWRRETSSAIDNAMQLVSFLLFTALTPG